MIGNPNRRPVDSPQVRSRRDVCRAAFSLVELVIVLAILAILAAIAVPRFGLSQSRYRVEAAAARTAIDLERTRDLARTTSQSHLFTLKGKTAYAFGQSVATARTVDLSAQPYGVTIRRIDVGTGDLVFDAFGMPDRAAEYRLGLGDESRDIVVDAGGAVSVSGVKVVQP